jgi:NTE family protein
MMSNPTVGLALGGGAARGLAHIVVLEALDDMGVRPALIAGCSIGALFGAAYASGLSGREIREHALSVLGTPGKAARQMFFSKSASGRHSRPINFSLFRPVTLNGLALVRLVSPPGTAARIEDTVLPFVVNSTDFYAGREVTVQTGDLETAVAASIAIPGVISAPKLNGRLMVDGAYTNPVPMNQLRSHRCDILLAVDVTGMPVPEHREPGPANLMLGSTQIMQKRIVQQECAAIKPEVLITPDIDRFAAHDFLKIKEILAATVPVREQVKRQLGPLLAAG